MEQKTIEDIDKRLSQLEDLHKVGSIILLIAFGVYILRKIK